MLVNITPQRNNIYNRSPQYKKTDVAFCGVNINAASEKGLHGFEYGLRIIGNKFADLFTSRRAKFITKCISLVKPEQSKKYLDILEEISNYYSSKKQIGFNLEEHKRENLYQSMISIIIDANEKVFKEEGNMCEAIYRIAREKMQDEFLAREMKGKEETLISLVKDGLLSAVEAAKRLSITEEELLQKMKMI